MTHEQKGPFQVTDETIALVNELLSGASPEEVARKGNMSVSELLEFKKYLMETAFHENAPDKEAKKSKVGRNDPCPCGSGKKYKKCCMLKEETTAQQAHMLEMDESLAKEMDRKVTSAMEQGLNFFSAAQYEQAIILAKRHLIEHPHEDRLHELLQLNYLYMNRPDDAEKICRKRWLNALKDKEFMREHGYQPRERDEKAPASAGFPPTAWLSKYWISQKANDYRSRRHSAADASLTDLIAELKTADDTEKFKAVQQEGLSIRKDKLAPVIHDLAARGTEVIPHLLPFTYRYSWTCLLIPDILAAIDDDEAIQVLMDIAMFLIAYASEASMKVLELKGKAIVPYIKTAFTVNKEFDPIKTGLISVLSQIHCPDSYSQLIELLNHPDSHVVNWTGGALAHFGDTRALPKMIAARERIGSEPRLDWGIEQLGNKKMQEN